MDLNCIIKNAKCCVADLAGAYVDAKNTGQSNENMFNELMLFNSYIKTLCTYADGKEKVDIKVFDISLGGTPVCRELNNQSCLSHSDIEFIIEQIKLLCESCECDC